jgi:hypothetical protein
MTDPNIRALISRMADELDHCRQLLTDDRREVHALAAEARAALAAEPVGVGPSDGELRDLWSWSSGQDQGPWPTQYHCFARAALARWGTPATPPAPEPGEAGELVKWLLTYASEEFGPSSDHPDAARITRAAALLQPLSAPAPEVVPVAADVQYEFSVLDGDDCEQAGGSAPTLDDAIREGQHYLSQYNRAWDPHRLELRSVQVIPLPQVGEGEG